MNENLKLILWLYSNCGLQASIDGIRVCLKLLWTKNFWSRNSIKLVYKGRKLELEFFGGLSMIREIFADEIYKQDVKDPHTIVDIGANVGIYSIWAACNYEHAKIYAYEPVSKTYELLVNNISKNKLTNIFPNRKAVTDKRGKATIYLSYASGFSSVKNSNGNPEDIEMITLQDVFESNKLKTVDILKIDTEGSEFEILNGGRELLKNVNFVMMEYHSKEDKTKILKLLDECGFEIIRNTGESLGTIHSKNKRFLNN